MTSERRFKTCKLQGEWAELLFMDREGFWGMAEVPPTACAVGCILRRSAARLCRRNWAVNLKIGCAPKDRVGAHHPSIRHQICTRSGGAR